jgi:hypothetical protein
MIFMASLSKSNPSVRRPIEKCLIVAGENTSSYLSLLDNTGEMLVAINDMNITEHLSADFWQNI